VNKLKYISTLYGKNAELFNVKKGGTYNNHYAVKDRYSKTWSSHILSAINPRCVCIITRI